MKNKLAFLVLALCVSPAFSATWQTNIDATTYGSSGTIVFDDHGYTGPTGVGANDFAVTSIVTGTTGFDAARIGQTQTVTTKDPDWVTSDNTADVTGDGFSPTPYPNANMDAQVNFYKWAYTTVGGSTFTNMQIDKAGNYSVAKEDMAFQFYDTFQYKNGTNATQLVDTSINFQPYAISDAKGWCGSVLTTAPDSLERMAGQVSFDFAFDAYLFDGGPTTSGPATQIVPDFVMRSYGDYVVNVTTSGGDVQSFSGSAVENNTDPATGQLDPDWQNKVSFLGAGVVPKSVWIDANSFEMNGTRKMVSRCNPTTGVCALVWDVTVVEAGTEGAVLHNNTFGGYAFLLRADGTRQLTYINPEGFSDYVASVPEPETYSMLLAGIVLIGSMVTRNRRVLFDSTNR